MSTRHCPARIPWPSGGYNTQFFSRKERSRCFIPKFQFSNSQKVLLFFFSFLAVPNRVYVLCDFLLRGASAPPRERTRDHAPQVTEVAGRSYPQTFP